MALPLDFTAARTMERSFPQGPWRQCAMTSCVSHWRDTVDFTMLRKSKQFSHVYFWALCIIYHNINYRIITKTQQPNICGFGGSLIFALPMYSPSLNIYDFGNYTFTNIYTNIILVPKFYNSVLSPWIWGSWPHASGYSHRRKQLSAQCGHPPANCDRTQHLKSHSLQPRRQTQ